MLFPTRQVFCVPVHFKWSNVHLSDHPSRPRYIPNTSSNEIFLRARNEEFTVDRVDRREETKKREKKRNRNFFRSIPIQRVDLSKWIVFLAHANHSSDTIFISDLLSFARSPPRLFSARERLPSFLSTGLIDKEESGT